MSRLHGSGTQPTTRSCPPPVSRITCRSAALNEMKAAAGVEGDGFPQDQCPSGSGTVAASRQTGTAQHADERENANRPSRDDGLARTRHTGRMTKQDCLSRGHRVGGARRNTQLASVRCAYRPAAGPRASDGDIDLRRLRIAVIRFVGALCVYRGCCIVGLHACPLWQRRKMNKSLTSGC